MAVGRQYTRQQIDSTIAGHAQSLAMLLSQSGDFKAWVDNQTDADLTALGYSADEITAIRTLYARHGILLGVITGVVPVQPGTNPAALIDFRAAFRSVGGYAF